MFLFDLPTPVLGLSVINIFFFENLVLCEWAELASNLYSSQHKKNELERYLNFECPDGVAVLMTAFKTVWVKLRRFETHQDEYTK